MTLSLPHVAPSPVKQNAVRLHHGRPPATSCSAHFFHHFAYIPDFVTFLCNTPVILCSSMIHTDTCEVKIIIKIKTIYTSLEEFLPRNAGGNSRNCSGMGCNGSQGIRRNGHLQSAACQARLYASAPSFSSIKMKWLSVL